jgi:hypothetical protein
MHPTDDPKKLDAALAALEAERERRVEAKVAEDKAIREPLVVVLGGPEDLDAKVESARAARLAELRAAGEKREVIFDCQTIITGVRRSGRDFDVERASSIGGAQPGIDDKPDYTSHLKRYDRKPPPLPKPPAEAVKPPEPGPIQTQVRAPSQDGKDPGEVISGWYDIQTAQNGQRQVVVWERSGGAPIGRAPYTPGDDPKVIARRLLREKRGSSSGFYGPISYRTH